MLCCYKAFHCQRLEKGQEVGLLSAGRWSQSSVRRVERAYSEGAPCKVLSAEVVVGTETFSRCVSHFQSYPTIICAYW